LTVNVLVDGNGGNGGSSEKDGKDDKHRIRNKIGKG